MFHIWSFLCLYLNLYIFQHQKYQQLYNYLKNLHTIHCMKVFNCMKVFSIVKGIQCMKVFNCMRNLQFCIQLSRNPNSNLEMRPIITEFRFINSSPYFFAMVSLIHCTAVSTRVYTPTWPQPFPNDVTPTTARLSIVLSINLL